MYESSVLFSVIFISVFGLHLFCDGATHWIVTEDGRIQQQVDSIFNLKRPYDLVTFIRQQDTFDKMRKLREEYLQEKRKVIEAREKERQEMRLSFYSTDLDCVEAGTPVAEFDPQLDTVSSFEKKGINVADHVDMCQSLPKRPGRPFCTGELPFSMYSYDHLLGVSARHEVDYTVTEPRLVENLPYFKDVDALGSRIKLALQKKPNSWVLLNLAAYYWRIKGNGLHAVECLRRALHYSPSEHRDRALLSLAAVLHHAEHTTDSIILMHASLEITDDLVIHLLLLGNLYSHLKMYEMAELCYKFSAALTQESRELCERVKAVRCELKLITMLETRQLAFDENLDSLKTPELYDGDEAVKEELSKSHTLPIETFRRQLHRLYNERIGLTKTTLCRNYKRVLAKQDQSWSSDRDKVSEKGMGAVKKEGKNTTASIQKELTQGNRNRETLTEKIGKDVPEARNDEATLESKTKEGKRSAVYNTKGSVDSSNGSFEEKSLIHDLGEARVALDMSRISSENGAKKNDGLDNKLPSQLPSFGDHKTIEGEKRAEEQTGKLGRGTEPRTGKLGRAGRRGEVGFKKGQSESNLDTRAEKDAGRTSFAEGAKIPKQKGDLTTLMNQNGLEQGAGSKNAREISRAEQIEQPMSDVSLGPKHLPPFESKGSQIQQKNCQTYGRKKRKGEVIMNECLNQMGSGEPVQGPPGNRNVPIPGETSKSATSEFPTGLSSNLAKSNDRPPETTISEVLSTKQTKNNIATETLCEDSTVMPHLTSAEISPTAVHGSGTKASILVSQSLVHGKQTVAATDLPAKQVVEGKLDSIARGNETKRSKGSKAAVKPIRSPDEKSFTARQEEKKTKRCDNKSSFGCSAFETSFANVNTAGPVQDVNEEECGNIKGVEVLIARNKLFSAWLSLETKNIDVRVHIDFLSDVDDLPRRPRCTAKIKNNQHTFDQLQGVVNAAKLEQVVEAGLTQTLLTIGRIKQSSVDELGTRIYNSMKKNSSSWILLNIASLYWRVLGDTTEAIKCLRQALYFSPPSSRDVAQVSLASILLREGRLEDTVVVIKKALEISPSLALGHFILGNVFGAQNKIPEAIQHYLFAIQLEPGFSPAIERLKIIQCVLWRQQKDLEKEADELRKLLIPT